MLVVWWIGCVLNITITLAWVAWTSGDGIPWDAIIFGILSLAGFARLYPMAKSYDEAGRR
jgi:hypothetical protein